MIYQHPLAYLLGLQGAALIRAFAGEYDREYTLARLAEVRALLDAADELGEGAPVGEISTTDYLQAALPLGFVVRHCEEPPSPAPLVDHTGTPPGDPEPIERYAANGKPPGIWDLHPWAPDATNAMYRDKPHFIVWHFEFLPDGVQ